MRLQEAAAYLYKCSIREKGKISETNSVTNCA